jgi:hypothetical protein
VLLGSVLYTWLKDREMRQIQAAQKQANAIPLSSTKDMPEDNDVVFDMDREDAALLEADKLIAEQDGKREKA